MVLNQQIRRKLHAAILIIFTLNLLVIAPLYAQRSRRSTPRRPATSAKTQSTQSIPELNQIEQRNQALLQQIMSLQKERDFYKKKITDWTLQQMQTAKKKPEEEKIETQKQQSAFPMPPGYILPITPELLENIIGYRKSSEPVKTPQAIVVIEDSLFEQAKRLATMGRYKDAIDAYEKLIRSRAVKDIHFLNYGEYLYKIGNYPRALEMLSGVTGGNRELSAASYYKARIYQQTGANTVAEIDFYRSAYLRPDFAGAEVGKAFSLFYDNRLDSAEIRFQNLLKRSSGLESEIYFGLAQIAGRCDDQQKAIEYYQKSLVHDPQFVQSYVELGVALYKAGDYQSCKIFFQQVYDIYNDKNKLHLYIGKSDYFLKHWDSALSEFSKIDDTSGGAGLKKTWIPKLYYIKCLIARDRGDHRQAIDYFRKAKEWNPEAYDWMLASLEDLGRIYEKDTNYNDALSYYSRLVRMDPGDKQTVLKIGKFYYYLGDVNEARKYFSSALDNEATAKQADFWLRQIDSIR